MVCDRCILQKKARGTVVSSYIAPGCLSLVIHVFNKTGINQSVYLYTGNRVHLYIHVYLYIKLNTLISLYKWWYDVVNWLNGIYVSVKYISIKLRCHQLKGKWPHGNVQRGFFSYCDTGHLKDPVTYPDLPTEVP